MSFSWAQIAGPSVTLSSSTAVMPTFTAPEVTSDTVLTFQLIVRDGHFNSTPDTVSITVRNVNQAPTANAGLDQVVDEPTSVTLDGSGSSDPDGDPLTSNWTQTAGPAVTLSDPTAVRPTFTAPEVTADTILTFHLIVRDGRVDSTPDTVNITVRNIVNQAPHANAGPDQTVECTGPSGASVTLNGSASFDPDGDVLSYTWTGFFGTANGVSPTVTLPVGTHFVTLTVSDGQATATDIVYITVQDSMPPVIAATVSPSLLWPPNHKMVSVSVAAGVSDACDAAPSCQIISVSSNEPINGLGDGDTAPDWQITGDLTVELRAERSGNGTGRIYTIAVQCTDASGNSSTKTVTVSVPHDQGKR